MIAAAKEEESSVLVLLQYHANIDKQNVDGKTALMVAAERKQLHVLRLLLQHTNQIYWTKTEDVVISKLVRAHESSRMLATTWGSH